MTNTHQIQIMRLANAQKASSNPDPDPEIWVDNKTWDEPNPRI